MFACRPKRADKTVEFLPKKPRIPENMVGTKNTNNCKTRISSIPAEHGRGLFIHFVTKNFDILGQVRMLKHTNYPTQKKKTSTLTKCLDRADTLQNTEAFTCNWSHNTRLRVLLRHRVAGLGVESSTDKSCVNNKEMYLQSNWRNRSMILGQRSARNSPCCIKFSAVVKKMWCLTTGPLPRVFVIFAEFSKRYYCWRNLDDLYCHEKIEIADVHCCFLVRSQFPVGCDNRCGFCIPEWSPVPLSAGLSCSACALKLQKLPQN